jgi:hypothetical protein
MFITVVPAYGRDYKSGKDVMEAWNQGKDFQVADMFHPKDGSYINVHDAPKGVTINVRYKKLTQIKPIKIK